MEQALQRERFETFSIGGVIGSSISIYFKNFVFFTLLFAILSSPILLLQLFYIQNIEGLAGSSHASVTIFTMFANLIVQGLLASISMYAVVMQLRGQSSGLGDAISKGIGRVFYALVTTIVVGIGVALGSLALVIPGLILACFWYVAVPASTIEKTGPFTAASRSAFLTKGYRWHIFGVIIILALITGVINFISVAAIPAPVGNNVNGIISYFQTVYVVNYLVAIPLGSIQAIAAAYAYYVLVVEKDGVDVDEIAKVFE